MAPHLGHLLWKIEHGHDLDETDRGYLARLVQAKLKRPNPRRAKAAQRRARAATTAAFFELTNDGKQEAGVQEAMSVHGVGRKYVFDALRELRNSPIGTGTTNVAGVQRRFVQERDGQWREVNSLEATKFDMRQRF